MKKTLLSFGLMFVFSLTLLIGTTFAWFSESITVSNNAIRTGTFDVDFRIADPKELAEDPEKWYDLDVEGSKIFDNDYLYPGFEDERLLKITNTGEIDAAVRLKTENGYWTNDEIRKSIIFTVKDIGRSRYFDFQSDDYLVLAPGETITIEVSYQIASTLGNVGQDQWLTFDLVLEAIQVQEALAKNYNLHYLPK